MLLLTLSFSNCPSSSGSAANVTAVSLRVIFDIVAKISGKSDLYERKGNDQ